MNQSKHVKNLSKHEMRLIAKTRGINVNKSTSKIELFRILKKEDKITYKESPFKSIIQDTRNKVSKNGNKLIKKDLYYAEKMRELTESQVKNIKEKLIKFKNELIRKSRIKKDNAWYYGGITHKGIKKIRYLFNEDEDEEDVKDIRYLFNEDEDNDVDEDRITYKESPFKSIIAEIRNKLSKNGNNKITSE